jgi:hypothetical protein
MARPHPFIIFAALICIGLAISALFLPQLSGEAIIDIIIYEAGLFIGIGLILYLIHRRALPDSVVEHNKPWP